MKEKTKVPHCTMGRPAGPKRARECVFAVLARHSAGIRSSPSETRVEGSKLALDRLLGHGQLAIAVGE